MELGDYLRLLTRRWWLMVVPLVVIGLLAGMWAARQPTTYDGFASVSFVKKSEEAAVQRADYRFDNFYSLQAGQLLTAAVHGWLADATAIAAIYDAAKVPRPAAPVSRYSKVIRTTSLPGATLTVQTNAPTAREAEALASEATRFVNNRLTELVATGGIEPVVVLEGKPLHEPKVPHVAVITLAGLMVGFFLGLIGLGLAEYFWPTAKHS